MENCQSSCNTCTVNCVDRGDMKAHMRARISELEYICEILETELADANAIIELVDGEAEGEEYYMEEDYD